MARTILITGGAGFIGSNFVRYVFDKYSSDRILVLDALTYAGNPENIPNHIKASDRFEFFYGNVTNPEIVNTVVSRSDVIVHFAAESHVARSIFDNRIFFETDVIGTQTIANAIVKSNRVERFIHISTSEVYGTAETNPMTEEHPLKPMSPYASAKAGADRLVYSYWATYGIPAVIIRPFNQYGPYQHLEKVVPRFVTSALKNEPLTVHGSGKALRDWLYVEDTCERIDAVMAAPLNKIVGEVFNLGSGEDISVLDIAEMVVEATGRSKSLITYVGDRLGQVDHHISSTDKAARILGIGAGRPFKAGLQQTIEWYANNRKWWEKIEWMKQIPILTKSGTVEYH
jgi:dTDP-glucose 4,6-dehydratase